jgi:hypothetical protein
MSLPKEGVAEAFEWLVDAWKFYAHPPGAANPLVITHEPVQATSGEILSQPPLVIAED